MTTKYLTITQLRLRDGIANSTRWGWVSEGKYPKPVKFGPKQTRWVLEEIEAWEAARIAESRGEAA
jgi:prophage regulatory protein